MRLEHLAHAGRDALQSHGKGVGVQAQLHGLRGLLRFAVARSEAQLRPKHFSGLCIGLTENRDAREHFNAGQLHFGGPALTSAGLWTRLHVSRIAYHEGDEFCVRCGVDVETTEHRLWLCPCNHEARAWLDQQVPGNQFPVGLPSCLARCGLTPSDLRTDLTLHHAMCVSHYLLWVNAIATQASADAL